MAGLLAFGLSCIIHTSCGALKAGGKCGSSESNMHIYNCQDFKPLVCAPYHNIPLAAPLAATLKDQSPNLKTALRLLDAYTSYSDETLKTTFDEITTDDFALVALPESLSVFGWTQLNKLEFSLAIQNLGWKGIKGLQFIVTEVVETESDVILWVNIPPQSVTLAGESLNSHHVFRNRFNADGKVVEARYFLDTKIIHDFFWSGPQGTIGRRPA
ncbi:uncharacterized protein EI90DRAFT_3046917 [Cantharellus anzutake]|uniref:uncharacterized protein n=1 Tax=Cantharellus anzutake TaxID=1750568 RepID=UPI001904FE03|nr:uncharacterized protein EI90DRAFT_3046917 [Cantharellus anzutake]KAF8335723.1 hypothetical protein EI90DRAFT_3046917 [Cantharellus anzutake]